MRALSLWGRRHLAAARVIIVISHLLLIVIALRIAQGLADAGFWISPLSLYFLIPAFIITAFFYPASTVKTSYRRRKSFDFAVASIGFVMMLVGGNLLEQPLTGYQSASAAMVVEPSLYKNPEAEKLLQQFKSGEKKSFSAKEKRIIRREFNHQLLQHAKAKITGNKAKSEDTLLIILSCIAAVGLLYLVAALACSLSCNGSDAAAIIVGVIGAAAIIWGLVAVIRSIRKKDPK